MSRLKWLLTALSILFTVCFTQLDAQQMRLSPQARTDSLAKQLALTGDQKAKVLEIFTAADTSMRAASKAAGGDRSAMRETMQKIRQETDTRMKAVLTEDQYTLWQKTRPVPRGRRESRDGQN